MKWTKILEQHGYLVEQSSTDVDPFLFLAAQAKASGGSTAQVTFRAALDFSKVACTVTIDCPQDERSINLAGEIAFRKAVELTNDGASMLGEPTLPTPE